MELSKVRENNLDSEKSCPTFRTLGPSSNHVAALSYQGAGRAVQLDLGVYDLLCS